ncbi:MAG: acyl-CoA dehydrogenase [Chloroflexi bacterium]|nr:MAG: acyl-CoA dehydrogenase [Chloroflexota bacterium]
MDLQLTEEQEMTKRMAGELAAKEIAPIAAEIDETGRFPREVFEKMAQAGLFGILIPPPFGGAGGERLDFVLAVEEIAAASASVALSLVESTGAAFAILAFGSDEQRKKYLPGLAKGERLGAVAVCEPSGGANWQMAVRTRAVADGDEYVVNGSKCFISNAGEADVYIVVVRSDPAKGPLGLSMLIIEKDTPGFSVGTLEDKFGLRGDPTGELVFADCRVPRENLLGQEGDAMKIVPASGVLDSLGQAAIAAGLARAALEAAVQYTKERPVVEPRTLADFETVQSTIAEMAIAVESARLLAYRAAFPATMEGPDPLIFLATIFNKEVAMEVTGQAVRLHGGYGCTRDYAVGRYFRDAKTLSLAPPAIDAIRVMAGKMLLGVPMGPPPGVGGPSR